MVDKILVSLISTSWGRNFIMWVFTVMVLGLAGLGYAIIHQSKELKDCNAELVSNEKQNSKLREQEQKERIEEYKLVLARLTVLEQRKKNRK